MADSIEHVGAAAAPSAAPLAGFTDEQLFRLRVLADRPDKPWWKDYPFLVSAMAFVLSLTVALVSAWTSYRRGIQEQQMQLSATIQTIQETLQKSAEAMTIQRASPAADVLGGIINARLNSLVRSASELALQLGADARTGELITVAQGLINLGDFTTARDLLQNAVAASRTANDEGAALRMLGTLTIRGAGAPALRRDGDELFRRALTLETKYPQIQMLPVVVSFMKASAELNWADALGMQDCGEALRHHQAGQRYLAEVTFPSPDIDQLRKLSAEVGRVGIGGNPNCRPR
jgi:hypothetical protein